MPMCSSGQTAAARRPRHVSHGDARRSFQRSQRRHLAASGRSSGCAQLRGDATTAATPRWLPRHRTACCCIGLQLAAHHPGARQRHRRSRRARRPSAAAARPSAPRSSHQQRPSARWPACARLCRSSPARQTVAVASCAAALARGAAPRPPPPRGSSAAQRPRPHAATSASPPSRPGVPGRERDSSSRGIEAEWADARTLAAAGGQNCATT